jgi:prepilin-type N-terminal cleavage/methylation domain-containing protein
MNRKFEIGNLKCARQGFTIVELLVAMSLLVMLLGLSGMVFNTTVAAHRAAGATIDVSRNLRAITDQLNRDFRGLRKDAPLTLWFELDPVTGWRYDQIQFFADGDFQTMKQYFDGTGNKTLYGNMARVYYGHAWQVDYSNPTSGFLKKGYRQFTMPADAIDRESSNILARRAHVSTNKPAMVPFFPRADLTNNILRTFPPSLNNFFEYDNSISLALWKQLLSSQNNCDLFLFTCFNNSYDPDPLTFRSISGRPVISMGNPDFLHNLLAQGVIQMRVQWAYTNEDLTTDAVLYVPIPTGNANYFNGIRWWPSADPDGNFATSDSDFDAAAMNNTQFGTYLEMPGGTTNPDWYRVKPSVGETPAQMALQRCKTQTGYFRKDFYPKALKFTIVLRDSNGVFANGKTFTHIVYLDN